MDEFEMWLGHERQLLDRVLYKLVAGRELMATREFRFLGLAAAELGRALRRLEEAELARLARFTGLAGRWQVPVEQLTLQDLAAASPEPYRMLFHEHRHQFLTLMAEIDAVARENSRLAVVVLGTAHELRPPDPLTAEAGYRAMLGATADLSFPSLMDFLADQADPPTGPSTSSSTRVSSAGRNGLAR